MAKSNVILLDPPETEKVTAKERAILAGQPVATFTTPGGKELPVYPKAQGYFYRIEEAVNVYLEALAGYDKRFRTRGRRIWPWNWFGGLRRRLNIDRIEKSKYRLFRLIFEDAYTPERHTDLTPEDFFSLPHDTVVAILEAYKEANDVSDILEKLIPDWAAKKKDLEPAIKQSFTRQ